MAFPNDPQTIPLRRQASSGSAKDGGVCNRFYFCSALLVAYCMFTLLYIDRGLTRSLSQPMIRKSADYLTQLADGMEGDRPSRAIDSDKNDVSTPDDEVRSKNNEDSALGSVEKDSQAQPMTMTMTMTSDQKPRLFLHVGPQKTGSSTLQSMLDKLSHLTEKLEDDNLYYRHIMPEQGDFDCELDEWGGWHNCRASNALKALIQKAKDEGMNLLLTDENLNEDFAHGLRDAIDDKDWDVTVIVMYRQIHEWLVSWYNQINKTTNMDSEGKVLFNSKMGIPYRTEHTQWPDRGGVHVPSFLSWYNEYTRDWEPSKLASMHRSIEYYNLYNESFENVLLYNIHEEGSMVTDFICNIIGAAHACDKIKSHEIDIKKINGSVHLDHDIISVYAYEQGLVPKTLARTEVVEAVTTYVQESGKAIPRKCNPGMTDQIRDWLVDTEKIMVGEQNWSEAKEKEVVELYESFVVKGKMCDVDTEAILLDDEWLRFFQSFGNYDKRNIVLHVGPIGGNTIHDTLTTMSGEGQALQKDNYAVVDIDIKGDYFDCTQNNCRASPKLKSVFSSLEGTGKNILISNDNLDERFVVAFKEAVDERKWNVKIVVGYLRLNQLLLMMYRQEYNYENLNPNGHFLVGQKASPNKEPHSKWPDQGGTLIPSFNVWFDAFAEDSDMKQIEQLGMHLRDAYISSFDDVDFFGYHQRKDLVTNFVCQILPGAAQTCKAAKASEPKDANQEPPFDSYAEADILAVRAHQKGLVTKGLARETVRDAIQEKLQSTKKVLSRVCASDSTKQLYDWMIESEKLMMGDKFTSKRIAWINQDFQILLESGKLCALDVEKELEDEMWVGYFQDNADLEYE